VTLTSALRKSLGNAKVGKGRYCVNVLWRVASLSSLANACGECVHPPGKVTFLLSPSYISQMRKWPWRMHACTSSPFQRERGFSSAIFAFIFWGGEIMPCSTTTITQFSPQEMDERRRRMRRAHFWSAPSSPQRVWTTGVR